MRRKCPVCGRSKPEDSPGPCSEACEEAAEGIKRAHRGDMARKPGTEPETEDEPIDFRAAEGHETRYPWNKPVVLYGLLTADDVRELERRRAMVPAPTEAERGGP